jgi:hypothetical protein
VVISSREPQKSFKPFTKIKMTSASITAHPATESNPTTTQQQE